MSPHNLYYLLCHVLIFTLIFVLVALFSAAIKDVEIIFISCCCCVSARDMSYRLIYTLCEFSWEKTVSILIEKICKRMKDSTFLIF